MAQPKDHPFAMVTDAVQAMREWRKWYLLGSQSIRSRYARSKLGQFWLTASYFITVLTLGIVYTYLWKADVSDYLPYLATSHVFWTLISGMMMDGCGAFTSGEPLLKSEAQPKGVFVMACLTRQMIIFFHNAIVLVPLYLIMGRWPGVEAFLVLPGLLLVLASGYWIVMALGMLCARFRDMPSLVTAGLQILFFVTPVLWQPKVLAHKPELYHWLIDRNPFTSALIVLRDPLLGSIPEWHHYGVLAATSALGAVIMALYFSRKHARLVYWL